MKIKINNVLKKINKKLIEKALRTVLIVISTAIIISMSFLLYITYRYQKYTNQKYPVYAYQNKANLNYEVVMIQNDIIPEKSLGEGSTYISSLVDYINTDLKYQFKGERAGEISGIYNIKGVLEGYIPDDKGNTSLWKRNYNLLPDTSFNVNDKAISIEKILPVKLNTYNDFMKMAVKKLEFPVYSKLTITWNIISEIKTDKGVIKESVSPVMEIPLNDKYFAIGGKLMDEKKSAIEETRQIISPTYEKKIFCYWCTVIVSMLFLLYMLIFTSPYAITDPLIKKLKKIFKEHGMRMVSINSNIQCASRAVIEVGTIDDLVRVADEIGRPILYESSEDIQDINNFFVIDESIVYMFDAAKNVLKALPESQEENNSINV